MDDQIIAGARDAARELGYDITASSVHHDQDEGTVYGFAFDVDGRDASVELLVHRAEVVRSGNTPRDYARYEILDALRSTATEGHLERGR
jgi:hypothetical protein